MQLALIFLVFIICVILMYQKKLNTLVGLPVMALFIAFISQIPIHNIVTEVISDGALRLHNPILVIVFGATLAEIVNKSGIIEILIKNTAEFLGDRTLLLSILLFLIVTLLFTVLGGLGAIVMVGSIVLPILVSIGVSKLGAACFFLLGVSLGGTLNLVNWVLYMEVLHLSQAEILRYILYFFPVSFLISILFIWKELRSDIGSSFKKQNLTMALETKLSPSPLAFLTPILPVFLVLFFGIRAFFEPKPNEAFQFPIITAMFIAIVFGTFVSPKEAGPKIQMLTRSIFDGIKNVAPAIALMVGIGILLKTVTHPVVKTLLAPSMLSILPSTSAGYILFFVFAAPLTLYRGPLNMWGMGSGIIALMQDTKLIPAAAIMAALLSVGQIQGVSDPTNTYNVWIANYLGVDVIKILKRTILWMWVCALFGLIVSSLLYYQTVPGVNQ